MFPAAFALLAIAVSASAQKSGAVEGTVSNSATGAPVKKALVALRSTAEYAGYQALTDAAGHFRIDNVEPGTYAVWAEAQGFVRRRPDVSRDPPPAQSATVKDGETVKDLVIPLVPMGSVSGKVVDDSGDPIRGANVSAMQYVYSMDGQRISAVEAATTDDHGEYRIFNLAPGRYYLGAGKDIRPAVAAGRVHSSIPEQSYAPSFYPGAGRPSEGGPFDLAPGADVGGFDFRLHKIPVYHIRGRALTAGGQPVECTIRANTFDSGTLGRTASGRDGGFDLRGLAPGAYSLVGEPPMAAQDVAITDHDETDVTVRQLPDTTIQGAMLVEGGSPDKLRRVRLILGAGAGNAGRSATPSADGSFTISNVYLQKYSVIVTGTGEGLYLRSIRLGDRDASGGILDVTGSAPLTLVFGSDPGRVAGKVQGARGGFAPMFVTLAPADAYAARPDLIKTIPAREPNGEFEIPDVAPGDYQVFAWELEDEHLAEFAGFRRLLESKATSVTVHAGERQTVSATLITAAEMEEARRKLR